VPSYGEEEWRVKWEGGMEVKMEAEMEAGRKI
jgi:hypothetical protein